MVITSMVRSCIYAARISGLIRIQLTSCSRQTFAFSRDGGLPFSRLLYRINRTTHIPVNCVWSAVFVALLLGLLAFAGPSAINAIFSLAITGQNVAFTIPIVCRFLGGHPWHAGPFSLGQFVSYVQFYSTSAATEIH